MLSDVSLLTLLFQCFVGPYIKYGIPHRNTFKYLNGQYNSAPILHLDSRTRGTTTRGHQLKLEKGRSRLDVRKHFFTQRVVNLWNALPVNLVSAPTVNAFKNRLDTLWKDAPFTTDPNAPNIYYTLY